MAVEKLHLVGDGVVIDGVFPVQIEAEQNLTVTRSVMIQRRLHRRRWLCEINTEQRDLEFESRVAFKAPVERCHEVD